MTQEHGEGGSKFRTIKAYVVKVGEGEDAALLYTDNSEYFSLEPSQVQQALRLHRVHADKGGFVACILESGTVDDPSMKVILPSSKK